MANIRRLSVKRVRALLRGLEPGRYHDGAGLYLQVDGPGNASWQRRYQLHGKEHWIGLGSAFVFGLEEARERNGKVSQQLADKIDPLTTRREERAQAAAARCGAGDLSPDRARRRQAGPTPRQAGGRAIGRRASVRTIIGRINRNDRTSKQRWERIQLDKAEQAHWTRQKRTGDALPRRAQAVVETGLELVKEAKGLGRGTGGKRAGSR